MKQLGAASADAVLVLAFVALGRAAHHHGLTAPGMASTAWPFLAGVAGGWVVSRAWRDPVSLLPAGLGAWLGCVGFGMALRVVAGQGTAPAFVGVALAFMALFLLGWRCVAAGLARRQKAAPPLGPGSGAAYGSQRGPRRA